MVTTSGWIFPLPSYRVESPVPVSEIQNGPIGLYEMPQGLTRFESVMGALPGRFETRFVLWYTPPPEVGRARAVPGKRNSASVGIATSKLKSPCFFGHKCMCLLLRLKPGT